MALLLLLLIVVVVIGFSYAPAGWQDPIKFGGTLLAGTVAACAFMLNINFNRLASAAKFIERYNDPRQAEVRKSLRSAINSARAGETAVLEPDELAEVLNLFEEMAILVKYGVVDEAVSKAFFRTTVIECSKAMQPWLEKARVVKNQPSACEYIEELSKRWAK